MKIKIATLYNKKRKTTYKVQIRHARTINDKNKHQPDYMMRNRENKKTCENI